MTNDYISRAAVLAHIKEAQCQKCSDIGLCGNCAVLTAVRLVESVPAADVVEVRHASWIEDGCYNKPCVCSNCGEPCKDTVMGKPRWNYCPNCGARMDGWREDD